MRSEYRREDLGAGVRGKYCESYTKSHNLVLREDQEAFELTPEEEEALLESIGEIERGEFVSGEQLLERLRRFD